MTTTRLRARAVTLAAVGLVLASTGLVAQASIPANTPGTVWPGRYPYTQADIDFMDGMIAHHSQAIVMAKWAPTHGASDAVQTLCARIVNAQTDEIALMQNWLKDRHQSVPEPGPMKMMMNGVAKVMLMPGMLSDSQLVELDHARGTQFDQLFLEFMIQHHKGALTMVDQLFKAPGAGQDDAVYKFASDVQADQSTEIGRMEKMLITLPGD